MAFASAEDFLNSGEKQHIGCLIADIRLPGMSGLDLQSQLNTDPHKTPIIFIAAHGDERSDASPEGRCSRLSDQTVR